MKTNVNNLTRGFLTALAVLVLGGVALGQGATQRTGPIRSLPSPGVARQNPAPQMVAAPSSSLFVMERDAIQLPLVKGRVTNPIVSQASLVAVPLPPPRRFAAHDLVTIIIREQTTASSESTLETEKETKVDGSVTAFPHLNFQDLLKKPLQASGRENFPAVGVNYGREFTGEGEYERRDSMTTRLTGRIIDIKPNGLLVIEARTHIQNDDEIQDIKVTGTWREADVAIDNTVLSTQGFDVNIQKTHEGELRKSSKKGLFTKILDTLFAF